MQKEEISNLTQSVAEKDQEVTALSQQISDMQKQQVHNVLIGIYSFVMLIHTCRFVMNGYMHSLHSEVKISDYTPSINISRVL